MENDSRGMGIGEEAKSVEELECERLAESFLAESGIMDGDLGSGDLMSFNGMAESSTNVQSVMGVSLSLDLGSEPLSLPVALEKENLDHDTHNKRPKVHSSSL